MYDSVGDHFCLSVLEFVNVYLLIYVIFVVETDY